MAKKSLPPWLQPDAKKTAAKKPAAKKKPKAKGRKGYAGKK